MTFETEQYRPQLVLTLDVRHALTRNDLNILLADSNIASVIVYDSQNEDTFFQQQAETYVATIQDHNIAAIIAGNTQIAGRIKADGIHVEGSIDTLKANIERHSPQMIVGYGNLRTRHSAMEAGELKPDYLFFGKLGADQKPDAHSRNLHLSQWWAELMEIPAIAQAGSCLESVAKTVLTGAEFIAIERVILNANNRQAALKAVQHHLNI